MLERDKVVSDLKSHVCKVVFTKKDGTDRTLVCSLREHFLPKDYEPVEGRKENLDAVSAWDLEKWAWRSFRLDSVKSFEVIV